MYTTPCFYSEYHTFYTGQSSLLRSLFLSSKEYKQITREGTCERVGEGEVFPSTVTEVCLARSVVKTEDPASQRKRKGEITEERKGNGLGSKGHPLTTTTNTTLPKLQKNPTTTTPTNPITTPTTSSSSKSSVTFLTSPTLQYNWKEEWAVCPVSKPPSCNTMFVGNWWIRSHSESWKVSVGLSLPNPEFFLYISSYSVCGFVGVSCMLKCVCTYA